MSLGAACGWSLLRSVCVAVLLIPLCRRASNELSRLRPGRRVVFWTLLLVPFLTPTLLTGYAYSNFSLSLLRHPVWNELLYDALLIGRLLPIGAVVLYFAPPPPVSREALYCARLALPPSVTIRGRIMTVAPYWIRGPLRSALPAFALLFLLVFQEFELASMMATVSWTVWLFDAQGGGMFLSESLRLALWPTLGQLAVLVPVLAFSLRGQFLPAMPLDAPQPPRTRAAPRWSLWVLGAVACIGVFGIPVALIGRDTFQGLQAVFRNQSMLQEIASAAGFGIASGISASLLAVWVLKLGKPTSNASASPLQIVAFSLSLPGLLGSLVISLAVLGLFQLRPLRALYDTPLPALFALVLFLLPRAILLQLLLYAVRPRHALHLARLMAHSADGRQRQASAALLWQISLRGQVLATCLVCFWGYLELTPVAILAPPGLTSAPVRLYNLMHYGRSHVLSALTLLAMATPLVLAGVLLIAGRWLVRWGTLRRR